jgi:hypothetical protein
MVFPHSSALEQDSLVNASAKQVQCRRARSQRYKSALGFSENPHPCTIFCACQLAETATSSKTITVEAEANQT